MNGKSSSPTQAVIAHDDLEVLIDALAASGYEVIGPTLRDGAIVCDRIAKISDLPAGWCDDQQPGRYRLRRRDDTALFGYAVGPQSWKRYLHPPVETLWTATRHGDDIAIEAPRNEAPKQAFIGVRACELHAIAVQDRVFRDGAFPDAAYRRRRRDAFIVAVNCGHAAGTCFCVSMDTGPKAESGFDLALTELVDAERHEFVVEAGSEAGAALLARVPHRPAAEEQRDAAAAVVARTAANMGRRLETDGIRELLQENLEHPRWDVVAGRCFACGNCTMACPTCFCTTIEDRGDFTGVSAGRVRTWDSCFTLDFTGLHGGSVRHTIRARYRQWMTHKLSTWFDQFGTSGCVGCGRCITWCPVGIDITEEAAAIRATPQAAKEKHRGDA